MNVQRNLLLLVALAATVVPASGQQLTPAAGPSIPRSDNAVTATAVLCDP